MIADLPTRLAPNLNIHCGATAVDFARVAEVLTPSPTGSWCPIPHDRLVTTVHASLEATGLTVGVQAHNLSHKGQRYFGLMEVRDRSSNDDYCWVLGLRNSHDKTFPAGIVAGASVFVCDNLSFSGEIKFARKHTSHIMRDLPQLVSRSVGRLMEKWHDQGKRIQAYKEAELTTLDAHDLIVRSIDVGVCSNRLIPVVLKEWREPRHEAFQERNT